MSEPETKTLSSPHLDALKKVTAGIAAGEFSSDDLRETLEYAGGACEATVRQFSAIAGQPLNSARLEEEVPKVMQALEDNKKALEIIGLYLEDSDPAHFDEGLKLFEESTVRLHASFDVLDEVALTSLMKLCVKCGYLNPPGTNLCEKCGAKLIEVVQEPSPSGVDLVEEHGKIAGPQYIMTSNLRKLLDAANDVVEGKISRKQFEKTINQTARIIKETKSEAAQLSNEASNSKDESGLIARSIELLNNGLNQFEQAVEKMRLYLEDANQDHLTFGFKMALDASIPLQAVININEEIKNLKKPQSAGKPPEEPFAVEESDKGTIA
ncbi:MAG: hypothetical protein M1536_09085 [Firmicutes bacterium]|nr:hypothetical protein [Bacillota bacterium]